jgi:hypothetical protein
MSLRTKKDDILTVLKAKVRDNDAMLKERIAALKVLLKHDRENTEAMVETMYDESAGIAQVQIADLLLRMIKIDGEKQVDVSEEINLDE